MGGDNEKVVETTRAPASGKTTEKSIGKIRIHENAGEVHFHDDENKLIEEICPTIAAWSKKPKTVTMAKAHDPRDGVVIERDEDLIGKGMLKDSWISRFGLGANKK